MRLLLDTHTFLWAYSDPGRLPTAASKAITDPENEVMVSAVSFWEISIKVSIGKLKPIGEHPSELVQVAELLGIIPISLTPEEAANYINLTEPTHFDPFDRMLICQAMQGDLILVSGDSEFKKFASEGLKLLWK